ncbi:MAG: hypothetical protein HY878_04075 [Deltaproteobacteria bacterium]|nr:hypothetical protein [Deltaproteobacteria bacterium]
MRTILYIVLLFLIYSLARGYLFSRRQPPTFTKGAGQYPGDELVLDPACKTYIPKDSALRVRDGEMVHYFCSEECRGRFLKGHHL